MKTPADWRVLIVDDSTAFSAAAADLAVLAGATEARRVDSAEAALEVLADDIPIDLLLLDVQLPGMTGLAAVAPIAALRPELPVVLTSTLSPADLPELDSLPSHVRFIPKSALSPGDLAPRPPARPPHRVDPRRC